MRTAIAILAVLFAIATAWMYFINDTGAPMPDLQVSEPTNFNEVGIVHFPPPAVGQAEGTFEYREGTASTTLKIKMDELSYCAAPNGAIPCIAMSISFDIPFNGKAALVEGVRTGDTILLRKIRVAAEGEELRSFEPGNVFISWPQAVELFKACKVKMATQTHSLDVYLDLKDGRRVRAVEPMIDEMFTIINQTQNTCVTFPVATE
jgi:hypothetical protein